MEFVYKKRSGRGYKYLLLMVWPRLGFNGFDVRHGDSPLQIPSSQRSVLAALL